MDALFGVHQLNGDVTLSLIDVVRPISSQVDNHCRRHHRVRKVSLNEGTQGALTRSEDT